MLSFVKALLALTLAWTATAESVIVPGAAWTDTSGNTIQAHGAGIFKVGQSFAYLRFAVTYDIQLLARLGRLSIGLAKTKQQTVRCSLQYLAIL